MIPLGILAEEDFIRLPENFASLRDGYDVHDFSDWRSSDPRLLKRCRSVEVLLTAHGSPKLPAELAEDFGRLRYVCHMFGTIRHVMDKPLIEAGLIVTNWGADRTSLAEGTVTLLLCMLKQIVTLNAFGKGGPDERVELSYRPSLRGRDVGIYGFSPTGRHVARMLEPFRPRVATYDPYAKRIPRTIRRCESLHELFATCQVVCICCGLNDQTRDSVTRELLELLPVGGIIINTARGAIVDEQALAELVARGKLLAGVDVIHDEKNWGRSPLAPLSGAVITHHNIVGGKVAQGSRRRQLPRHTRRNLRAYKDGRKLINIITAEMYDLKT